MVAQGVLFRLGSNPSGLASFFQNHEGLFIVSTNTICIQCTTIRSSKWDENEQVSFGHYQKKSLQN